MRHIARSFDKFFLCIFLSLNPAHEARAAKAHSGHWHGAETAGEKKKRRRSFEARENKKKQKNRTERGWLFVCAMSKAKSWASLVAGKEDKEQVENGAGTAPTGAAGAIKVLKRQPSKSIAK